MSGGVGVKTYKDTNVLLDDVYLTLCICGTRVQTRLSTVNECIPINFLGLIFVRSSSIQVKDLLHQLQNYKHFIAHY